MSEDTCHLGQFGACCCRCKNQLEDRHHPTTSGMSKSTREHKGFICFSWREPDSISERPIAFSGWSEHGMCESFCPRTDEDRNHHQNHINAEGD